MRRLSLFAWLLAFAWCSWASMGAAALDGLLGGWGPDLVLLLLAGVGHARTSGSPSAPRARAVPWTSRLRRWSWPRPCSPSSRRG